MSIAKTSRVSEKIDLFISFGADNKSLHVTAHYYENNIATNDAKLFAFAGNKRNPAELPLEGLLDKDGLAFDLFTQSNGMATSEVLIESLPANCTTISVVAPHGARVKKDFNKAELKALQEVHGIGGAGKVGSSAKKDPLVVETLLGEEDRVITARGIDYPFRVQCLDKKGNSVAGEVFFTANKNVSLSDYESDAEIARAVKKHKLVIPVKGLLLLVRSKAISDVQISFLYLANKPVIKRLRKEF